MSRNEERNPPTAEKLSRRVQSGAWRASTRAEFSRDTNVASALDHPPPSKVANVKNFALKQQPNDALVRRVHELLAQDRETTAELIAHLAEIDERQLYLPAAYPSMHEYCVDEFGMTDDEAYKRIRVARAAQQFPGILEALAEGRLHMTAVLLLAPHLEEGTGAELLEAAEHKTKSEIAELLAERFPRAAVPAQVTELAPERVHDELALAPGAEPTRLAPERVVARPAVTPLAPQMYALQVTIGGATRGKLEYAKALLGHQLPSGDLARVLDHALDALVERLEKRKFGVTARARATHKRTTPGSRHIAMHVRREVFERDEGRCTYVS